jgi:NADH-quinone oxidoreductase subunit L
MMLAVGVGAYSSGIFHLATHAFFKALLFMGAGAVIIALHHEQNIFKMGGLKKRMGLVTITMLIATLAISGIPPFAGFFSKDAILASAFASGHYVIWGIGTVTALLTAYYMFRLFFVVFYAKGAGDDVSLQPLPGTMTKPLVVLAIGSATVGLLGANAAFGGSNWFASFIALPDAEEHLSHSSEYLLAALNVVMALMGIGWAYKRFAVEAKPMRVVTPWQKLAVHKFYIDELYEGVFVKPILLLSRFFDRVVDRLVVDGVINLAVFGYRYTGVRFAQLQNGKVRYYALYILIGVAAMSLFILMTLGEL